jgi:hypothetical protein
MNDALVSLYIPDDQIPILLRTSDTKERSLKTSTARLKSKSRFIVGSRVML